MWWWTNNLPEPAISLKISFEWKKIYKEIIPMFRFSPMEGWQSRELKKHLCFRVLWQKPFLTYLLKGVFVLHLNHSMALPTDTALLFCLLFQLSAHLTPYRKRNNRLMQSFILNSEEVTFKCFEDVSIVGELCNANQKIISGCASQDSYLKSQSVFFHNKRKKKEKKNRKVYIWKNVTLCNVICEPVSFILSACHIWGLLFFFF